MAQALRGFILQPTYRIERGRPVVHLWGRLEGGDTFLVRDDRLIPHFYVRATDAQRARELGARVVKASERVSLAGEPVARVEVPTPPDTPPLRNRLQRGGIACFEADIRFAIRYLIDHGVRGSLAIRGESKRGRGVARWFENPEIEPADWVPELAVLSFDIETDPRAERILSIALCGAGASEVLLLTPEGWPVPAGAIPCASEAELLRTFTRRVREIDPDVLTGWNADDFDFPVLIRRAGELRVPLELGRGRGGVRRRAGRGWRQATEVNLPGRLVMDGLQLLRGAFLRMEQYSLDFVAREVLGEGKTISGHDRAEEILRCFREDRAKLVEYNLTDARLVLEILAKLQLVELAVERSRLTGLPPDRVASSVAAFDFLYLSELGRRGVVAPSVGAEGEEARPMGGGHVFEPSAGLYENVLVFDVKSLYPSIIRTFQIDPLGLAVPGDDAVPGFLEASFARQGAILPELIEELWQARDEAKRNRDAALSQAVKILMNSFYGVLGSPGCRFYDARLASSITRRGHAIIQTSRDRIEAQGHAVIYGDTDSLFVLLGGDVDEREANAVGADLAATLNAWWRERIAKEFRLDSFLEIEFETLYLRFLMPTVRGEQTGSKKRYAGLVRTPDGGTDVIFKGLESVRTDWTALARRFQRELYRRVFLGLPFEEYLRETLADLLAGRLDEELVYRKRLRRAIDEYTRNVPPHVQAARKLDKPGRWIRYVITANGPEPVRDGIPKPDYEHYRERQLAPAANGILHFLDTSFEAITDAQLAIF